MSKFKSALGELLIIVIGVLIALAGDNWRTEISRKEVEAEYLERLRADLASGLETLEIEREGYRSVRTAAEWLINAADAEKAVHDPALITEKLLTAAAMGFDREEFASDVTYREMLASGQLQLISDQQFREGVVSYYRGVERQARNLEGLPPLNMAVASLTGFFPLEFRSFGAELTEADRHRLLGALDNPDLLREIRMLHAGVVFYDREFERLIENAEMLLATSS